MEYSRELNAFTLRINKYNIKPECNIRQNIALLKEGEGGKGKNKIRLKIKSKSKSKSKSKIKSK
jgi:hypothetical protein